MRDNAPTYTTFDQIIMRRLQFEDIEMFDLIIDVKEYKRVVITNFKDINQVVLTSNLEELDTLDVFDVEGKDVYSDSLIVQSRIIFNSFVADEYQDEDFDLTTNLIFDDSISNYLSDFVDAKEDIKEYLADNYDGDFDQGEAMYNDEKLKELEEELANSSNMLDMIFLEEQVIDYLGGQENLSQSFS